MTESKKRKAGTNGGKKENFKKWRGKPRPSRKAIALAFDYWKQAGEILKPKKGN